MHRAQHLLAKGTRGIYQRARNFDIHSAAMHTLDAGRQQTRRAIRAVRHLPPKLHMPPPASALAQMRMHPLAGIAVLAAGALLGWILLSARKSH
jgi:hypothetical protein